MYKLRFPIIYPGQYSRYVQSLMDAKLLNVNTDSLNQQSVISLNLKYTNKRTKFRIAGTVQKETPQEIEATHHAVEEDRKMYLQAAIVRIMKSRKLLKHNALIQEVLSQSKVILNKHGVPPLLSTINFSRRDLPHQSQLLRSA